MLDTLLIQFSVTREQFQAMFNISERTYQRWNKSPPTWATRLLRDSLTRNPMTPQIWQGWTFKDDLIIDPDGNQYHINEIRAIFWNRQLIDTLTGNHTSTIRSLKQHLDKRILATQSTLNISLENNDKVIQEWKIQV